MPIDYSKGKIYCIRNRADNDRMVYVGSTVRTLSERMTDHRKEIKRHPTWKLYERMSRVGVEHFHIELLADFPCERREQLVAEEGRLMRLNNMVEEGCNERIAGRSWAEYIVTNRDKRNKYFKTYNAAHVDERKTYKTTYYEANREEVKAKVKAYREAHQEERNAREKANYHRKKAEREAQAQAATPASD